MLTAGQTRLFNRANPSWEILLDMFICIARIITFNRSPAVLKDPSVFFSIKVSCVGFVCENHRGTYEGSFGDLGVYFIKIFLLIISRLY